MKFLLIALCLAAVYYVYEHFFSAKAFKNNQLEGINEHYLDFMADGSLTNPPHYLPHVVNENLLSPILNAIKNGENGLEMDGYEYNEKLNYHHCQFRFHDSTTGITETFQIICWHYYSGVLNVLYALPIPNEHKDNVIALSQKINRVDLLHQLFFDQEQGTLMVFRQFCLSSGLSDVDTFIKFLGELAGYAKIIGMLDAKVLDDATSDDTVMKLPADTPIFDEQGRFNLQLWRKCNIGQRDKTSENPIRTAEEILYPQDENDVLEHWASTTSQQVLENGSIEHSMYFMSDQMDYQVTYGQHWIHHQSSYILGSEPKITTYSDAPYLVKLSGTSKTEVGYFNKEDEPLIQQFCDELNSQLRFSLSKIYWNVETDGSYSFDITITGLIAGPGCTMTVMGLIGLYEKTVCAIHEFHWRLETSKQVQRIQEEQNGSPG